MCLGLTNFTEQIAPSPTNQAYFTNYSGTNLVVSGTIQMTAMIGPVAFISWRPTTDAVYVQTSTNLADWQDIRVVHLDTTYWWDNPQVPTFYRLRLEPRPTQMASVRRPMAAEFIPFGYGPPIDSVAYHPWTDDEKAAMRMADMCEPPGQALVEFVQLYDWQTQGPKWLSASGVCCWRTDGQVSLSFNADPARQYDIEWHPFDTSPVVHTDCCTYYGQGFRTIGIVTNASGPTTFQSGIVCTPSFFRLRVE